MNATKEVAVICDALGIQSVPVSLLHDLAEAKWDTDAAALLRKHAVRRQPAEPAEG